MRTALGNVSGGFNAALIAPIVMIVLVCILSTEPALSAQVTSPVTPAKSATTANYLTDPTSWTAGSIIVDVAPDQVLQETPGGDVKFISSDRCYLNIPTPTDGTPAIALPAGFSSGIGQTPTEIYNNIVNQSAAIFLVSVFGPRLTDPSLIAFDCHTLTFAYKQKAKQ